MLRISFQVRVNGCTERISTLFLRLSGFRTVRCVWNELRARCHKPRIQRFVVRTRCVSIIKGGPFTCRLSPSFGYTLDRNDQMVLHPNGRPLRRCVKLCPTHISGGTRAPFSVIFSKWQTILTRDTFCGSVSVVIRVIRTVCGCTALDVCPIGKTVRCVWVNGAFDVLRLQNAAGCKQGLTYLRPWTG
jgi:hypothetical protein